MSVADRVEDARLLALQGRNDGALLNVLLAVAAASAEAFPESTKQAGWRRERPDEGFDGWRFRKYLAPRLKHLLFGSPDAASESAISIEFKGQQLDLEALLYKRYRNSLVHEGMLPHDVKWSPGDESTAVSIGGGEVLMLGGAWLRVLAMAALDRMPTNAQMPAARRFRFTDRRKWTALEEDLPRHHVVPSGMMALADALLRVDSTTPQEATPEQLQSSFTQLATTGWVNATALSFMRDAGCVEGHDRLTPKAYGLLREMADLVEFLPA